MLSNRASSKKYYEKNKEKEREKARLRMASLRSEENGFRFTAISHDANRISSKKFYEQNKEKEREKARRRMALLRAKRAAEASAANDNSDLSYLDGEGDEHLKDIPALELWRQTFKREIKNSLVQIRYSKIVESDTTIYANQEEENAARSDLYEALEVEVLLADD